MNINEIADKMAKKFGVDGLESKNGALEIEIDGAFVRIEETAGDVFIVYGLVGEHPSNGGEEFAKLALKANMALMNSEDSALAQHPESNAYLLIERVPISKTADFEEFCECLGKFVDTLESWREMLKVYKPVQAAAAENEAEGIEALRRGLMLV